MIRPLTVALATLVLACPATRAHDSPSTVIHALTHRLEDEGPTARTLTARAFEYQSIHRPAEALADFSAALHLQPDYRPALLGAAEANLRQGLLADAAAIARRGLAAARDPAQAGPFHTLLARIHARNGDERAALASWRDALRSPHVEIEWLVGEADCLGRLGRHQERCEVLAAAMQRNPSVVLQHAWIHALIDAGRLEPAAREVETQLAAARWRSSWLVLRARIAEQQGDRARQREDAAGALRELQGRLNPAHPDPQLAADRATAQGLLDRARGDPREPATSP